MKFGDDSFGFLINDAARLMRRTFMQSVEDGSLTLARARALVHLARNEGIRQVALAELLEIQPMTLARLIDQLAAEGLVERRADPSDRRAHCLYLTASAGPQLDTIAQIGAATYALALEGIDEAEREIVMAVLRRVRQNLAARGPQTKS